MTSYTAKPGGSVTVKQVTKGDIAYVFKGKPMHCLSTVVVSQTENLMIVKDEDGKMHLFVRHGDRWLLEEGLSINSILHGTEFIGRN